MNKMTSKPKSKKKNGPQKSVKRSAESKQDSSTRGVENQTTKKSIDRKSDASEAPKHALSLSDMSLFNNILKSSSSSNNEKISPVKPTLASWAKPPWPEWSDAVINRETWEQNESMELFEDPAGTGIEPTSLKPEHWIRPGDLFLEPPQLVDWSRNTMDLISPNAHLCEASELIRYIISEVAELFDFGMNNDFQIEGEGSAFVTNSWTDGISWKPWDHIYSCCKAGVKGEKPDINTIGKYYVRLYYMGAWRRITVDDKIPLLKNGLMGVPLTDRQELWPMILTKALLKIACMTFEENQSEEVKTFSAITALTGWVHEWTDLQEPMTGEGLWSELLDILPKYKLPPSAPRKRLLGEKPKTPEDVEDNDKNRWPANTGDKEDDIMEYWYDSDGERNPSPEQPKGKEGMPSMSKVAVMKLKVNKNRKKTSKDSPGRNIESVSESPATEIDQKPGKTKKEKEKKDKEPKLKKDKSSKKSRSKKSDDGDASKAGSVSEAEEDQDTITNQEEKVPEESDNKTKGSKKDKKEKKSEKEKEKKKKIDESPKGSAADDHEASKTASNSALLKRKSKKRVFKKSGNETGYAASVEESFNEDASANEEEDDGRTKKSPTLPLFVSKSPSKVEPPKKVKIPLMSKILKAVRTYLRFIDNPTIAAFETSLGKNVPTTLAAVLRFYPTPEEDGVVIPSFLYHPLQLVELRDVELYIESNKPPTPRWKQYRWKAWAMKKGLIPMAKDPNNTDIRCIKMKTPFVLKTDWDKLGAMIGLRFLERLGELDGEDNEVRQIALSPPPPPPPGTAVDTICGGGKDGADGSVPPPIPSDTNDPDSKSKLGASPSIIISKHVDDDKKTGKDVKPKRSKTRKQAKDQKRKSLPSRVSSPAGSEVAGRRKSTRRNVLNSEEWNGETENEQHAPVETSIGSVDEGAMSAVDKDLPETVSPPVCGTVWFDSDKVAPTIRKLCKYYGTRNKFGTTVVISRTPDNDVGPRKSRANATANSDTATATSSPPATEVRQHEGTKVYRDFHSQPLSKHLTITYESFKLMKLAPCHVLQTDGIDSAFYLFCDSWTPQEIIIQLDLLQERIVDSFVNRVLKIQDGNDEDEYEEMETDVYDLNVTLVLEPWDWKRDCFIEAPIIYQTATSSWMTHLNLPAGRHTFRLWVVEEKNGPDLENEEGADQEEEAELEDNDAEENISEELETIKNNEAEPLEVQNENKNELEYLDASEVQEEGRKESARKVEEGRKDSAGKVEEGRKDSAGKVEDGRKESADKVEEADLNRNVIITPNKNGTPVRVPIPYSIKLVSKTPIHVGSRDEIQKYLTNEPVLFLKQCDKLSHCFWNLFLQFGKSRKSYTKNLINLRRTYCPLVNSPDVIKSSLREVHLEFENYLVSLIKEINNGEMSPKLLFTLRILFLNPKMGEVHSEKLTPEGPDLSHVVHKLEKFPEIMHGIITIQKYCRGWLVRRLFQYRTKTNKKFLQYEYQVRKIAFLFAQQSEADFSAESRDSIRASDSSKPTSNPLRQSETAPQSQDLPDMSEMKRTSFSITPNPPKWAVRMIKHLFHHHPLLVTIHPHAYCLPHHVRIKDVDGILPDFFKATDWYPFFREVIHVTGESKPTYCTIQLQTNPDDGIIMQIIDNDTYECLSTVTPGMFMGSLKPNQNGYTLICYRWTVPRRSPLPYQNPFTNGWKIRIITPVVQNPVVFQKEVHFYLHELHHHELHNREIHQTVVNLVDSTKENPQASNLEANPQANNLEANPQASNLEANPQASNLEANPTAVPDTEQNLSHHHKLSGQHFQKAFTIPRNLCSRRFSGYYLPSQNLTICKYKIETLDEVTHLSLRFKASYEEVRTRLEVWDLKAEEVLFELDSVGGFMIPSIILHAKSYKDAEEQLIKSDTSFSPPPTENQEDSTNPNNLKVPTSPNDEDSAKSLETLHSAISLDGSEFTSGTMLGPHSVAGQTLEDKTQRYLIHIYVLENSWEITPEQWEFVHEKVAKTKKRMEDMDTVEDEGIEESDLASVTTAEGNNTNKSRGSAQDGEKGEKAEEGGSRARSVTVRYDVLKPLLRENQKRQRSTAESTATQNTENEEPEDKIRTSKPTLKSKLKKLNRMKSKMLDVGSIAMQAATKAASTDDLQTSQIESGSKKPKGKKQKRKKGGSEAKDFGKRISSAASEADGPVPFNLVKEVLKPGAERKPCHPSLKGVFRFRRQRTANLIVETGGRHSQRIKHVNQPNWVLDVVTDADQECFITNERVSYPPDYIPIREDKVNRSPRKSFDEMEGESKRDEEAKKSVEVEDPWNNSLHFSEDSCSDQQESDDDWDYLDFLQGAMDRESFNDFGQIEEEEEEEEEEVEETEEQIRKRKRSAFAETQEEALLVDWILDAMFYADQKCEVIGDNNLSKLRGSLTQLKRCDEFAFWDDEGGFGKFKHDEFSALDDRNDFLNWISEVLADTDKYWNNKELFKEIGSSRKGLSVSGSLTSITKNNIESQEPGMPVDLLTKWKSFLKSSFGELNSVLAANMHVAESLDSSLCHHGAESVFINKLNNACRPTSATQLLPKPLCVRKIVSPPPLAFRKRKPSQQEIRQIRFLSNRRKITQSESCLRPDTNCQADVDTTSSACDSCRRY